jgi:glucosamine--fructose-6-phosphate aminotransferase (isomerizing)
MCGIAAYVGKKSAGPMLLEALKRLEYRGYDSAGIAIYDACLQTHKKVGEIEKLRSSLNDDDLKGTIGLGHTRWATHGPATEANAHPHLSQDGQLAIVHNGTVINYYILKERLVAAGYSFYGDTDSEVLINYIDYRQKQEDVSLPEILHAVASEMDGRSAFVVFDSRRPDELVACNFGGEMFVGRNGDNEFMICSDKNALAGYADETTVLEKGQMAILTRQDCRIINLDETATLSHWEKLETSPEDMGKGAFPHFMLKEIFEQDEAIRKTVSSLTAGHNLENNLKPLRELIQNAPKAVIIACGTSWHAGLVARHFFAELAGLPVYAEYASEFLPELINEHDIIITISQSGSTADTIQAAEAAKKRGAKLISICNVAGSPLPQISDVCFPTKAGIEIGVASTKAFTTQLAVLFLLASQFGEWRGKIASADKKSLWSKLDSIPENIRTVLRQARHIEDLANKYHESRSFLYLGRGKEFPIALEGALKLKEVSYIHAEGLSAGEMKHGSIALIDKELPSFFIAVKDEQYDKVFNNILEIKARGGRTLAITSGRDELIGSKVDDTIEIPVIDQIFYPFLTVIPLQLFAYHVARLRGVNIDKPRNLAKSVTVE